MKHEEERELSTPASTPNPLSPIMPLGEATQWLREYFTREPAFTPGDDFGTCFSSYAAVMLSAMVIGTESPVILAGVTSYPAPFVAAVCNGMRRDNLWSLANVLALNALLKETPSDWAKLRVALNDAMEFVWVAVWSHEAPIALESLRRGVLFGGEVPIARQSRFTSSIRASSRGRPNRLRDCKHVALILQPQYADKGNRQA
jgi:hypothetical protein